MVTEIQSSAERRATREAPARPHAYRDLFLVSFAILFFELACIRWFGSTVIFLTFFTNVVLLASFVGTSIGCLAARSGRDHLPSAIPYALVAVVLSVAALQAYSPNPRGDATGRFRVQVGERGSPQQVYFGTESYGDDPSKLVIPIEAIATVFFIVIAMAFVGPGQVMGRSFAAAPDRVAAYTVNVAGSLVGIAAFGVLSYLRAPPYAWFALATTALLALDRLTLPRVVCHVALLAVLALEAHAEAGRYLTYWSPYYKVQFDPRYSEVMTNNIGHQSLQRVEEGLPAYVLPHLLNRDAGGRPFGRVLIIGAGSGNDVQGALAYGAEHVAAIEIDPVIFDIGRARHPDRPYQDPRVTVHLNDGRRFARRAAGQPYDLAVYALVDSLVLHSGYSSVRLESFLFTEQAFRDIKARLGPKGVFVLYNYYRQGWVVGRLAKMAEQTFGSPPIVIPMPYKEQIAPSDQGGFTLLIAGGPGSPAEAIREKLARDGYFWIHKTPRNNRGANGYGANPPSIAGTFAEDWERLGAAAVDNEDVGPLPTDDWPFLYLRDAKIPGLNLRGMALMAAWSLVMLALFTPSRTLRPNGQMFFLGAGFMLLESKGVVHMALLFGSTWVVNTFVFAAVLDMILLANLFVLAFRPRAMWPYYTLLLAALAANVAVPMETYLGLRGVAGVAASCTVVFLPIFFAGVIFATAFRDSVRPDIDFGSNIAGVILGGLSENLSLIVGFNHLLVLAAGYYVLSWMLRPRA